MSAPETSAPSGEEAQQQVNLANARYTYNDAKLQELRKSCPWTNEAKYFSKAALSPSALTKIMMHCHSGVEKGIKQGNGNPIEVMGMLLGRPDPDTPKTLIVTDAFPLPIEGFETRVIADDENVVNHMIALGECLEKSRKEKFMGWYHSHPFEVGQHSHSFLSQTDLSTQLQWQRAEDPHGNPFVAIVVDPLRSLAKSTPQLKAFRAYPPDYSSPVANECPDGSVVASEQLRLEQWGSCWNRYYELRMEYYMSSSARMVMEQLTQDYLWIRTLGGSASSGKEQELQRGLVEATTKMKATDLSTWTSSKPATMLAGTVGTTAAAASGKVVMASRGNSSKQGSSTSHLTTAESSEASKELEKACQQVVDLATSELADEAIQGTKREIFGKP